jgi:hypothetical protein
MTGTAEITEKTKAAREKRIEQLKAACDSIKENAADFIGNEEFPRSWEIRIVFDCNAVPCIELRRESIPSEILKRTDIL